MHQTEMICLDDLVPKNHQYRHFIAIWSLSNANKQLKKLEKDNPNKGFGLPRLFKCLLLQFMEDLSDRELERFIQENNTAKWFCQLSLNENTPDHTVFSRCRKLIGTTLLSAIFSDLRAQLKQQGVMNEVFSFIDATHLVSKAQLWKERDQAIKAKYDKLNNEVLPKVAYDKQARIGCKGKSKYWYGYKQHVSTDMQSGLINKVAMTAANVTDAKGMKEGVNFVKAEAITAGGNIDHKKLTHVSLDIHEKYRRSQLAESDVLFTMAGVLGRSALVRKENIPANTNQAIALIRPKKEIVFPLYLFYALRNPALVYYVNNSTSQSAQPSINLAQIGDLTIPLPPLPEQKAIAHILGSLDDKIELNRKMNATLEAMAQALFKSWFVDFDPVIDNALRAGNPIPEELAPRAEIRKKALAGSGEPSRTNGTANEDAAKDFPAAFQETEELGWIPKGWEVKQLRAITTKISKGTTPRKSEVTEALDPETIPFLKVRDITDSGDIKEKDFDLIPRSIHENSLKRSILSSGDVLFSIAGTIGRISIVDDSNINQAIAFIRSDGSINLMFILEHLRGSLVQDRIHSRVVQAVQANISLTEIGDIPVPIPSAKIHDAWKENTSKIYQKIATLKLLNSSLTKLRDTLLPKLISGELRIPHNEKVRSA